MKHNKEYIVLLEQLRWGGQPQCPYCESKKSRSLKGENRYQCNDCYTSYSVTVGTLFHKTRVDLEKWFVAIKLVLNSPNGISVRQLAKKINVNKNTSAYMISRIYQAQIDKEEIVFKVQKISINSLFFEHKK